MFIDLDPTTEKLKSMLDGFLANLPNIFIAVVLVVVFYIAARLVRSSIRRAVERTQREAYAALILSRLAQWAIIILGIIVGLSVVFPSVSAEDLISILGISGIIVGFAFRDIAQNFLAGILLLITQPFKIGDQIVVNEFEGTVVDIETRSTQIRTYDGRLVVIPNSDLFTQPVTVNTADDIRRSEYDIGIAYDDDIELAKRLALEAMSKIPAVIDNPAPDVLAVHLDNSSVNLRARWWTESKRRVVVKTLDDVIVEIKALYDEHGITIPFPIRTLYVHDRSFLQTAAMTEEQQAIQSTSSRNNQ